MSVHYSIVNIGGILWVEGVEKNTKNLVIRSPIDIFNKNIYYFEEDIMTPQENETLEWLVKNHPELFL